MNHDISAALDYIARFQFHGFRLGLERMSAILKALYDPHLAYPCVHIAGTNGKGSTCAVLENILNAAGYKTGLYTSPHLKHLKERFRISGRTISEADLARLISRIRKLVEAGYELSYFEYTTTIAMTWFAEHEVDIAVFETGLGGRLDATNVVAPLVSVITNISPDHQRYLGQTLERIAHEKAGIIKPGVPVVSGIEKEVARGVIRDRCAAQKAPLREMGVDFFIRGRNGRSEYEGRNVKIRELKPALLGRHQMINAGLACAACEILMDKGYSIAEDDIREGCGTVRWPGRGELLSGSRSVLLDGGHNKDGIAAFGELVHTVCAAGKNEKASFSPVLLWACSNESGDKDFAGMLEIIQPLFHHITITEPPGPRSPVTAGDWKKTKAGKACRLEPDWKKALDKTLSDCGNRQLLCVGGSLYLVGAVRAELLKRGFYPCSLNR